MIFKVPLASIAPNKTRNELEKKTIYCKKFTETATELDRKMFGSHLDVYRSKVISIEQDEFVAENAASKVEHLDCEPSWNEPDRRTALWSASPPTPTTKKKNCSIMNAEV